MRLFVSPDGAIAVHQIDGWQEIEVCPVAERDTAREERDEAYRELHDVAFQLGELRGEAERLRGAIEAHKERTDASAFPAGDCDVTLYAALQPPDGTGAMFTDAWERPE